MSLCIVLKNVYHCRIHDATRKLLTINVLGVFRVVKTPTLKTVKYLSLSNLQVALRPLDKGAAIGQQGCPREDLPPWSCFFIGTLSQPLTLRVAFASSTYLLPQWGGQNRLFCLRRWIYVCKYGVFAPVVLIDIVPNCGPNCGKSPLSSGGFAIRLVLCRCSARRIAR